MLEGGDEERRDKEGGDKGNKSLNERVVRLVTAFALFFAIVAFTAIVCIVVAAIMTTIQHCRPAAAGVKH